jgi:NhaP-type Na+/H+ or K+/H+ antiporter
MNKLRKLVFYVEAMLVGIGAFAVLFVAGFFSAYIVEKWPLWMEALK